MIGSKLTDRIIVEISLGRVFVVEIVLEIGDVGNSVIVLIGDCGSRVHFLLHNLLFEGVAWRTCFIVFTVLDD